MEMTMTPTKRGRAGVQARVVDKLKAAQKGRTPELMRELAQAVVEMRQEFEHEGMPDWGGRSQDYRDAIYRVYRDAGVGSDAAGPLQANLRYHVGNVVREVAPPEHLEALGMDPEGPRGRAVRARSQYVERKATKRAVKAAAVTPLSVMQDPLALASFARDAIRQIRALEPRGEMAEALVPQLRDLAEEIFSVLAEVR